MLTQERYQAIIQAVESRGAITVAELVDCIGTSESTIRRDLSTLSDMGKINKVRGGATAIEQEFIIGEFDVRTKSQLCVEEKNAIAKYAASTIQDGEFIFIDAGTSTGAMIDYLTVNRATYVTNGIAHAKRLISKGLKTYLIGGLIKPSTEAVVGVEGINSMRKYNFTKAFLGTNGIQIDHGYTTVDVEEAAIKKEAVERSYVSYILADHTKFDKVTAVTFASIEKACIVTDCVPKEKYRDATFIKEVLI